MTDADFSGLDAAIRRERSKRWRNRKRLAAKRAAEARPSNTKTFPSIVAPKQYRRKKAFWLLVGLAAEEKR